MIDFQRLLSIPYWVTRNPNPLSTEFASAWLAVTVLLLVGAMVVRIGSARQAEWPGAWINWYQRLSVYLTVLSVLSGMFLWFRYERIPVFAGRWWILVWLGIALVWGVILWRDRVNIKNSLAKRLSLQKFEKYLPKRKK